MLEPGDLLLIDTHRRASPWIDLAALLTGTPSLTDHVAIVHHTDGSGTLWVIEGRPGGVGWQDARAYLRSRHLLNNARQHKKTSQRQYIADLAYGLLGTPYDWSAIVHDAMEALGVRDLWAQDWRGLGPPGHVICSSLAAYAYQHVALEIPSRESPRFTTPADWARFVRAHGFEGD